VGIFSAEIFVGAFLVYINFCFYDYCARSGQPRRRPLSDFNLKSYSNRFSSFLVTTLGVMASLSFLPNYLSAIVSLMLFVFLLLGYVFGRVALQVSVGKQLQKRFLPEDKQSETVAILIGVIVWTLLLSAPYLWLLALIILLSASIGLVLTARSTTGWQRQ
jgi:Ca2+/Na+ antiporter